jgi:chromosome segregation ATPase
MIDGGDLTPNRPGETGLTPADEGDGGVCALDGCENPLPPPPVDDQGRRKGGRRPKFCCKPHADEASRRRKAVDAELLAEPLAAVRAAGSEVEPAARDLIEVLERMLAGLEVAEHSALGQVHASAEDAATAREQAEEAIRRMEQATQERARAVAAARDDRVARDQADRDAKAALDAAETARTRAAQEITAHERARGSAEARADAAEYARDEAATRLRDAEDRLERLRTDHRGLREHLDATQAELAGTVAVVSTLTADLARESSRAEAAEAARDEARELADEGRQRAEVEATRLRAETAEVRGVLDDTHRAVAALHADLAQARQEAIEARALISVAESRGAGLADALELTRTELAAANARVDRLISASQGPGGAVVERT